MGEENPVRAQKVEPFARIRQGEFRLHLRSAKDVHGHQFERFALVEDSHVEFQNRTRHGDLRHLRDNGIQPPLQPPPPPPPPPPPSPPPPPPPVRRCLPLQRHPP